MTNGGGMFEHEKADELSRLLHVPIDPDQVILSHTPMKVIISSLFLPGRIPFLPLLSCAGACEEVLKRACCDHR